MKRLLALVLVCVFVLSLAACGGDGGDTSSVDTGKEVSFATSDYVVVRSEGDTQPLVAKIIKAVRDKTKVALKSKIDTEAEPIATEILIGDTNRPESATALDYILDKGTGHASEYVIAYVNGKIVINALSNEALVVAVDKFVSDYCVECKVSDKLQYVFVAALSDDEMMLNGVHISRFKIVVPQYNRSFIVVRKIDELVNVIKEQSGYTLKMIEDNVGAKDEYEIIIGDCKRDGVKPIADFDKYEIANNGKTIFVNGGRNYSVAFALEQLINVFKQGKKPEIKAEAGTYSNDLDYKLVWTDEFDTLDKSVWNVRNGQALPESFYGGWLNRKPYRSDKPENVRTANGKLYIAATYDDQYWYGAYLETMSRVEFNYGYTEISSSLANGAGLWHCFWVWGDGPDHIEFDIMECWSGSHYYASYIHEFADGKNVTLIGDDDPHVFVTQDTHAYDMYPTDGYSNMHEQMHTFGCEWTTEEVLFFRDGELTMNYRYCDGANAHVYETPHHFVLSMLVGSNYAHQPDGEASITGVKCPNPDGSYWQDGNNTWTLEYLQLFQKDGQYFKQR